MYEALLLYFTCFALGCLGAFLGSLVFSFGLRRRCTQLEITLGDIQQRQSSFKGKEMAETRWNKQRQFDEELRAMAAGATPTPSKKRYDNDPLGE